MQPAGFLMDVRIATIADFVMYIHHRSLYACAAGVRGNADICVGTGLHKDQKRAEEARLEE